MSSTSSNVMDTVYKNSDGTCCRLTNDASNFVMWKGQVSTLLTLANCKNITLGIELCPPIPIGTVTAAVIVNGIILTPASTTAVDPITLEKAMRDINDWDVRMRKAVGILWGSVSAPVQPDIQRYVDPEDPATMWKALNNQFDTIKSEGMTSAIMEQFYFDRLSETERVDEYITRLKGYQSQLAFTDEPLSDTNVCSRLLGGLTPIWKQHVLQIRLAQQTRNLDYICTSLRSFARVTQETPAAAAAAATTSSDRSGRGGRGKGRGRGRGRGSSRGRGASTSSSTSTPRPSGVTKGYTVKCWLCNETGHKLPDCPEKKRFAEYKLANGPK